MTLSRLKGEYCSCGGLNRVVCGWLKRSRRSWNIAAEILGAAVKHLLCGQRGREGEDQDRKRKKYKIHSCLASFYTEPQGCLCLLGTAIDIHYYLEND